LIIVNICKKMKRNKMGIKTVSVSLAVIITVSAGISFAQDKPYRIFFDTNPINQPEIYQWIKNTNFTTGFVVKHITPADDLRRLYQDGFEVGLSLWANIDTRFRQDKDERATSGNRRSLSPVLEKHIVAANGDTGKVIWELFVEDESAGVGFPYELLLKKPSTHAEAFELFQNYLVKSLSVAETFGNVKRWALPGFAGSVHQFARFDEIDLIGIERANDDVDDLQTGIAFTRGAAKQYNKMWAVDYSLWWGVIYGGAGKIPTSYHKRNFYISYFSGSDQCRLEGVHDFYDYQKQELTYIGKAVDEFGKFTLQNKPGEPETFVAVILPKDHGWNTPPYWRTTNTAWNYARIPYRQGQKAIDAFFCLAFPGSNFAMDPFPFGNYKSNNPPASPFALSCVTPEYAPAKEDVYYAEPSIPFGKYENRIEAGKDMNSKQVDQGPYRPMGNSRWGDIIDVFTDDVSADVLKDYKVIVLLDQIDLNKNLQDRLILAMNAGATVISATGVVKPEHSGFSGAVMDPQLLVGRAWNYKNKPTVGEPYRFVPAETSDAVVIATTDDNSPLLIEKSYGKGKLVTCMVPWFEGTFNSLNGVVLYLLDEEIGKVQPVMVEGPSIEFLSSKGNGVYNVLLSNNSSISWEGKIKVKNLTRDYILCRELLTGERLHTKFSKNEGAKVEVEVPPFDVRVISWSLK